MSVTFLTSICICILFLICTKQELESRMRNKETSIIYIYLIVVFISGMIYNTHFNYGKQEATFIGNASTAIYNVVVAVKGTFKTVLPHILIEYKSRTWYPKQLVL